MKALSGRQPWWWAILHAGKRIENRRWNTKYRGPILLHASGVCTADDFGEAVAWMLNAGVLSVEVQRALPPRAEMVLGGIVGRARIVDVIHPCDDIPPAFRTYPAGVDGRWHMPEQYGFVLADVAPLPFIPCKGALSLWSVTSDLEASIAGMVLRA